jgi:hypothetical protein
LDLHNDVEIKIYDVNQENQYGNSLFSCVCVCMCCLRKITNLEAISHPWQAYMPLPPLVCFQRMQINFNITGHLQGRKICCQHTIKSKFYLYFTLNIIAFGISSSSSRDDRHMHMYSHFPYSLSIWFLKFGPVIWHNFNYLGSNTCLEIIFSFSLSKPVQEFRVIGKSLAVTLKIMQQKNSGKKILLTTYHCSHHFFKKDK